MKPQEAFIDRQTVDRFFRAVGRFATSPVGWQAKIMFAGLVALLLGVNGMNVLNNYVGRDFMTAIEHRDKAGFGRLALAYLAVFAGSTLISVFAKVLEDCLGLLWRDFITRQFIRLYLFGGAYYRLDNSGELQNPDQRIAEDVRAFTVTSLSFQEQDWGSVLSLAEQQLLAFIHVLLRGPRFVFLDRTGTALSLEQFHRVLGMLTRHSISYIAIAEDGGALDCYDAVLEIGEGGRWGWKEMRPLAQGTHA